MARKQQHLSKITTGREVMRSQSQSFAQECVSHYAEYEHLDHFYSLDVHELPDFVQHEFAAVIMSDDNAYACEATGPDNKHWESKMLPALTRYLKNSTDKDEAIEFQNVWRDCVADHMNARMQELLNDALQDRNSEEGFAVKDWNHHYGVTHLFA
jgi:hypothetical protein